MIIANVVPFLRKCLLLLIMLLTISVLSSCKVVHTHVVKLISTPQIDPSFGILVKSNKGNIYLSSAQMTPGVRDMLLTMRLSECLAIRTPEPFNMTNRKIYFTDFKLTRLVQSDAACRKIKTGVRIYID